MANKTQDMEKIYREHSQTVYRYLLTLTGNSALAEEYTQETFFRAVKNIDRFDKSCKITTWLCAIAKNVAFSEGRKGKRKKELFEESALYPSPEEEVISGIGRLEILKLLHSLPENVREIMYLRLFGDLSFGEIGAVVGTSENSARVAFYRGKEKLRKELLKNEE